MEENNNLFEGDGLSEVRGPESELPQESELQQPSDLPEPPASVEEAPQPPDQLPAWDLTCEADPSPKKRGGSAKFFAVFGGVFLLCVALLVATFFLGEGGFVMIRELYNERVVYVREDDGTSGLLTPNEAADVVKASSVTIVSHHGAGATSIGSGFVYDESGHICTNYHVIEGAEFVQVILPGGAAVDATVVGYDEMADLAVLRVEAAGLVPAKLGSSAELLVGDAVVAVGSPVSLELPLTATFGNVSATRRLVAIYDNAGNITHKLTLIQTDASVNPGNSGGAMADMYGRVVGVVVRKYMGNGSVAYEGLGFAIPIDGAKTILDAIIKDGVFRGENPVAEGRSLLGVTGFGVQKDYWYYLDASGSVTSSEKEQDGYTYMPVSGIYVDTVSGQNAKGLLRSGDIITEINGLHVSSIQALISAVNLHRAGEVVNLTVYRSGSELTVNIRLTEE